MSYNENVTLKGLGLEGTHLLDHIHLHWGENNDKGSEHSLDGKFYPAEVLISTTTVYCTLRVLVQH